MQLIRTVWPFFLFGFFLVIVQDVIHFIQRSFDDQHFLIHPRLYHYRLADLVFDTLFSRHLSHILFGNCSVSMQLPFSSIICFRMETVHMETVHPAGVPMCLPRFSFYFAPVWRLMIILWIGFPRAENFSSYSVITFPLIISSSPCRS